MVKNIISIALISSTIYANNALDNNYTFVFSNVKNIDNANYFISKYFKDKKNVSIIKYNNRYRVIYGSFKNRSEAHNFKLKLPPKLKSLKPFLIKRKIDILSENDNSKSIIEKNLKEKAKKIEKVKLIPFVASKDLKSKQIKVKSKPKQKEHVKIINQKKDIKVNKKTTVKFDLGLEYFPTKLKNSFSDRNLNNRINAESDLGLNDISHNIIPQFGITYENHNAYISYMKNTYKNSGITFKDLTFDGFTYNSGEKLSSKYDTSWLVYGYKYKYKDLKIGFDIHDYRNKLVIDGLNNTSTINRDFIFPAFSFDMKHKINQFNFLYGGSYGRKSNELDYYDYHIGIMANDITIGYKNKTLDIEDNNYNGKTTYTGPFLNIKKSF